MSTRVAEVTAALEAAADLDAAVIMARYRFPRAEADEQTTLHRCSLDNAAYVNNRDLVDLSCPTLVGGYLLERDRSLLDRLARSPSIWERRIAMISTHALLRRGQTEDVYRIAVILISDSQELIHKAVGWSLREAGKRVSEQELLTLLINMPPGCRGRPCGTRSSVWTRMSVGTTSPWGEAPSAESLNS